MAVISLQEEEIGKGAPSAPNPVNTIQQQTSSNRETAITNAGLGMIDQTDALGNRLNYAQTGTWADGTPRYSSTQTLSAPGQQLLATGQKTQQNLANLAQEQSGRLSGLLNAPLDWSAQRGYLNDLTAQNLNPQWDRMAEQNEQALVNRGLRPGSTAYNNAADEFRQSRSNAFNSANLNNYNSALQSMLGLRNQGINEISALAGGSQVQTPQFGATPSAQMAGTDTAGITNSAYQQQMAQYNAGQQQLGGLFSAGASLIPLFSDIRLKANIVKVGEHPMGFGVYEYDRLDTGARERGVLAQEVRSVRPDLVDDKHESGFLRVYYEPLGAL